MQTYGLVATSHYSITGNFCGFGLKRRHLFFADFIFCGLKISAPKKNVFVLQEATTEAMLRQTTGAHYSDP